MREFISWIEPKLDAPGSFYHSYFDKRQNRTWSCDSLYTAFQKYDWSFAMQDAQSHLTTRLRSFEETHSFLMNLSTNLKLSILENDNAACRENCLNVLKWGGVLAHNQNRIKTFDDGICSYLLVVGQRLSCDMDLHDYYNEGLIMNSGFTKIYSLCLDHFIMYDGRVGAALGLLVRRFCENRSMPAVPGTLRFAWGKGKEASYARGAQSRRNPSSGTWEFPELINNPRRHLESNIQANWLLEEILLKTSSRFNALPQHMRISAIQSALFMIGYSVECHGK